MIKQRVVLIDRTCKYCHAPFQIKSNALNRPGRSGEYCSRLCLLAFVQSPEYFWSLVHKTDGCWLWRGCRSHTGYGHIRWGRVCRNASRVAYGLTYGKIDSPSIIVRHKCDNRLCVNPEHLETGTSADNSRDMTTRNRQSKGVARHNAKLTDGKIREIRRDYVRGVTPLRHIAQKHGISIATTSKVVNRQTWRHVE